MTGYPRYPSHGPWQVRPARPAAGGGGLFFFGLCHEPSSRANGRSSFDQVFCLFVLSRANEDPLHRRAAHDLVCVFLVT